MITFNPMLTAFGKVQNNQQSKVQNQTKAKEMMFCGLMNFPKKQRTLSDVFEEGSKEADRLERQAYEALRRGNESEYRRLEAEATKTRTTLPD